MRGAGGYVSQLDMILSRKGRTPRLTSLAREPIQGRGVIILIGGWQLPPGEGLGSLSEEGEVQLMGDITFSAGSGIMLTQVGNNIEIALI